MSFGLTITERDLTIPHSPTIISMTKYLRSRRPSKLDNINLGTGAADKFTSTITVKHIGKKNTIR